MAEIAEKEGKKYLEESERLNKDPSAEIPEALDKKCLGIIKREFTRNNRREVLRIFRKIVNKVAVLTLLAILLFTTAYATIPEVRIKTLNMLIVISDVATSLTFGSDTGRVTYEVSDDIFFGYVIPHSLDGFSITEQGNNSRSAWVTFKNEEGAAITYYIGGSATSVLNVDTEDADSVEQITIHGYEGLVIEKGNQIHVVWGDTDQGKYVSIVGINVDRDTVTNLANNM